MRPFFVKGEQYVFLWRFLGLLKAWKGNQDFVTWIAQFEIVPQRVRNSGMDLLLEAILEDNNPYMIRPNKKRTQPHSSISGTRKDRMLIAGLCRSMTISCLFCSSCSPT